MKEWQQRKFGELYKVPSRNGLSKPSRVRGSGYKMINMGELFANDRIYDIDMELVPLTDSEKEKAKVESGDLLFARQSLIASGAGKCSIVMKTSELTVFESHLIRVRLDQEIADPMFYYYYFKSPRSPMRTIIEHCVQAGIKASDLEKLLVKVPPIEEQRKTARVLSRIDKKIEVNKEINENLLQQALAIYKAWFCDYVLSDGVLPESWHITTIDALSSLVTRGIAPKYDDNNTQIVLNQKCIRDHTIDVSLARRHLPKKINEKWISKGDLLINSTGTGTLGRVAQVWFDANNMTVDSHITIVRPKAAILQSYIGFWGLSHESEIEAQHTGSTGQTELPRDRVKAMELTLPDEDTLSKFNELVIPMTDAIVSNQKENARLSQLRDTLLPKLMSGKIDVSELEL